MSGAEKTSTGAESLESLPNLGAVAVRLLRSIGIDTPEELQRVGSIEAALRIRSAGDDDTVCRSRLSALEGAIRGVRWHAIPKGERERLWSEYRDRVASL
jgi:DNA transformation protein